MRIRIGKNAPCRCGSGLKFKDCCGLKPPPQFPDIGESWTTDPRFSEVWSAMVRAGNPQGQPVPSVIYRGYRFRAVRNRLYWRRPTETFHEFLCFLLKTSLGNAWYEGQLRVHQNKQHQVVRWYKALSEQTKIFSENPTHREGNQFWFQPTGDVQALITLAYDVFHLLHRGDLPAKLLKRLKDHREFQGARYEIAVAALFVRAGLRIKFITEKTRKHCEFTAKDPATGATIEVEAKSRHRPGILHEQGEVEFEKAVRGDVEHLLNDALEQSPGYHPFMIFVDLNAPTATSLAIKDRPWFKDIWATMQSLQMPTQEHPDEFNVIFITNFSYHWYGIETSGGGEYLHITSQIPKHSLPVEVIGRIMASVQNYGFIPREI